MSNIDSTITNPRLIPASKLSFDAKKVALMALMTAVETITTIMIVISIPASEGYFNLGEAIIFFTAIIFGPGIGAFAGGVGAALADLILGYGLYAPATLIAKSMEGFLAGWLYQRLAKSEKLQQNWKIFTFGLGLAIGLILIILGQLFTSGNLLIGLYINSSTFWELTIQEIERYFWFVLAFIFMALTWFIGFGLKRDIAKKVLGMVAGGTWMVLTYFLYESLLKGAAIALVEMPFNVLQVLLGILIAVPLITSLEKYVNPT